MIFFLIGIGFFFFSLQTQAQKVWTMDECIDHALHHAVSIRQQQLQIEAARDQVVESKLAFTPSVSANTSGSFSWGHNIDPETNTYNTVNYFSTGFSLGASMTLWDGGRSIIALREAKLNMQRQLNELQRLQINLELNVIQAYINALYYQESQQLHQQKLADSRSLLRRTQVQAELGLKGKADLTQIEAQVADDELSCLLCENQYQQAILELGKMMGKAPSLLPRGKEIKPLLNPLEEELSVVNLLMNNSSTKVTISSPRGGREGASHPAALSARMNVQSAELAVQQARASFFPSLSISAGVSTGYSRSYGLGYHPKPFGRQWHDNMGSSISTGISIPLWDHLSHVHHLRRSKRQLTLARIEQEETLRQLQIDYTKACLDVEACEKEIAMQTKKLAADSVAHAVLLRRYEEGLSSLLDLQTVARTLQQSRISLLQQRLLLILKRRTLKQYGYFS